MGLLTQNKKMRKSSGQGVAVFNFGIPAFTSITGQKTCPNAGACVKTCFARGGAYVFNVVKNAYEVKFAVTQSPVFVSLIDSELQRQKRKHKRIAVRIHDSGDFYSEEYLQKWLLIIKNNPETTFYAYTKRVSLMKRTKLPDNFKVIYSFGGKEDSLIDIEKDAHSFVFPDKKSLIKAGYDNATDNDLVATKSKRVGLVYLEHGAWEGSGWDKIYLRRFNNGLSK